MKIKILSLFVVLLSQMVAPVFAQNAPTDATTPLHLLKPDYTIPYGIPKQEDVAAILNRVHGYLDGVTPIGFINEKTGAQLADLTKFNAETVLARGDFRIVSYEWGVTYAGMLLAAEATGDAKYRDYAEKRMTFIADSAAGLKKNTGGKYEDWEARMPLRNLIAPS